MKYLSWEIQLPEECGGKEEAVARADAYLLDWGEEGTKKVRPAVVICRGGGDGFSAGGHLACSLGAFWNRELVWGPLGLRAEQIRPAAMLLSYPVITSGPFCHSGSFENLLGEEAQDKEKRHLVSLEHQVGPHTPRTFVWHTAADASVPVQNSLLLAQALAKSGVSVELHIYPEGCHGLSLATEDTSSGKENMIEPRCQSWIKLAGEWLADV